MTLKLMNNAVFEKTIENVRNIKTDTEILKLVTAGRKRTYLVSEPNYHTTKFFTENLLAIEMKKNPVYLGLSILELSEILMSGFWYDYVNLIFDEKAKLC